MKRSDEVGTRSDGRMMNANYFLKIETRARSVAAFIVCVLCFCLMYGAALGQSGRRASPPKIDPPVPMPTPEPTPKPKPTAVVEKRPVLIFGYVSPTLEITSFDFDLVMETFVRRLRDTGALNVSVADKTNREQPGKRAKAETDTPVVRLELETAGPGNSTFGGQRPYAEDLRLEYIIYAPVTGRVKDHGIINLRPAPPYGGRGGIGSSRLPDCYPRAYGLNYSLIEGAFEAGNEVVNALGLPVPPPCP